MGENPQSSSSKLRSKIDHFDQLSNSVKVPVAVWTEVAARMAEGLRDLLAVLIKATVLAHGAAVAQADASATWGMMKSIADILY